MREDGDETTRKEENDSSTSSLFTISISLPLLLPHFIPSFQQDQNGSRRALEKTLQRLDEANQMNVNLQDEILQLRNSMATKPRDFTEKGPTSHELV